MTNKRRAALGFIFVTALLDMLALGIAMNTGFLCDGFRCIDNDVADPDRNAAIEVIAGAPDLPSAPPITST